MRVTAKEVFCAMATILISFSKSFFSKIFSFPKLKSFLIILLKDWLKELLKNSKVDLMITFPKDSRSDGMLMRVAQEKV